VPFTAPHGTSPTWLQVESRCQTPKLGWRLPFAPSEELAAAVQAPGARYDAWPEVLCMMPPADVAAAAPLLLLLLASPVANAMLLQLVGVQQVVVML